MRTVRLLVVLGLVAPGILLAMQRVSMEAPVVRGSTDDVTVTARFTAFKEGSEYRLGVGGGSAALNGVQISLERDGNQIAASPVSFDQSQNWWGEAGELKATGFNLDAAQFPPDNEYLTLRVVVPRTEADARGAFYIFVAKRYGPNTWYLEDGAEINEAYW